MTNQARDEKRHTQRSASSALPSAVLKPRRRVSALWILPVLALILAGALAHRAWQARGVVIVVQLREGHGLKPGDPVHYRGITVGEVRDVELAGDLQHMTVTASLQSQGDRLAVRGSRFWVVRPEIGFGGVAGLETLLGPRHLAVLPGSGPSRRFFVGLEEPPIVERIEPGDVEIIARARHRGGLRAGAPVQYRKVRVGSVLSVGLTSDAGAVEARLHVRKAYAPLIREGTRFWRVGGVQAEMGLTGMTVNVESLESLVQSGVAFATPPVDQAGGPVRTGHRFELADAPDDDWLEWEPVIAIGSSLLPPGAALPYCRRAKIAWEQGLIFRGERFRQGWVLPTDRGLLGPANLLRAGEKAEEQSIVLEVSGRVVPLDEEPVWTHGGLTLARIELPPAEPRWSSRRWRRPEGVEDCLVIADPTAAPLPLAASRLTTSEDAWLIDEAVPIDESWHGASVLARSDGYLLGLLVVEEDEAPRVALLPEEGD